MKLIDIISEETVGSYITRLTKTLHIKKLGDGAYSMIFQHPVYHNVAVKLCERRDPKTIIYLRECMKRPNNPWLPNIIGIHKVAFHDDAFQNLIADDEYGDAANYLTHIVFMQKLKNCTNAQYKNASRMIMSTMPPEKFMTDEEYEISGNRYVPLTKRREHAKRREAAIKAGRIFPPLDHSKRLDAYYDGDWMRIAKYTNDPHVRELAELMYKIRADDIYESNVMIAPDGHPVITDPVAS